MPDISRYVRLTAEGSEGRTLSKLRRVPTRNYCESAVVYFFAASHLVLGFNFF